MEGEVAAPALGRRGRASARLTQRAEGTPHDPPGQDAPHGARPRTNGRTIQISARALPREPIGTGLYPAPVKVNASAGILLYRRRGNGLEVLLAHPGGPYWRSQEFGSWSVPQGIAERDEALEAVAAREFHEEVGFELPAVARNPATPPLDLGEVQLKSGKVVRAWAVEGDLDPALCHSNEIEIEWPPRSGRRMVIPEVDRVAWFSLDEARQRAHPAQAAFVDRLALRIGHEVRAVPGAGAVPGASAVPGPGDSAGDPAVS